MRIRHMLVAVALAVAGLAGLPAPPAAAVPGGTAGAPPVQCTGDGLSGNRVHLVYTYEPGTNRFSEREPAIRAAAWTAQQNINDSARRDGAQRWLRFLGGDTGCHVIVNSAEVPAGTTSGGGLLNLLKSWGYNAPQRIYVIVAENHRAGCGGTENDGVNGDTTPSTSNLHNTKTFWITFQPACFNGHTLTHELAHALGGVQSGAPHYGPGYHCTDGNETLCQDTATIACPDPLAVRMLDCGRDDYFAVNPQGSYLTTHFNAALHSLYLQAGATVPAMTTIPALPPQVLRATDVEGTSIAFSFLPSMLPRGSGYTSDYQILRDGSVVATVPGWQTTARVTGLPANTAATYTVRQRVTYGSVTRTSADSQPVTVTTNGSTSPAGQIEAGSVMMFTNDLVDVTGPNLAMDLYSFNESDNAEIKQWPANGVENQQWKLTSAGSGFTVASNFSLKCLTPLGGATAAGTPVVQTPCTGTTAQQWTFPSISGLTYQIRSVAAGRCVQSEGAGTGGGVRLVLATCDTTQPTQRWTANRVA
ncbi:RICIN domain-containing protein [Microbispora triticiradicis]|uniref:RICIN domain-containing protein n=1 Tax=Microbispora triticiradicis TaxID=2200763 RepID=UPI001AD61E8B|nr:RICIN domain-containing protein [Microbispora triticiradicis]MBO4271887.1 hypothetical protein [Microbispora triticiradicis]